MRAAAPEEDTLEITEDVIWKGVVGNKVSRYLGPAADSFRDTVNEYGQVLRQVVRKLKNVNRPKTVSVKRRARAHQTKYLCLTPLAGC